MELMIVMMIVVMMTMICSIGSRLGHRTCNGVDDSNDDICHDDDDDHRPSPVRP